MRGGLVGPRQGVPVCWGDLLIVGCGACVGCPGMFGFLILFGVVGGKPRWRVSRSQFLVLGGRWRDTVGMGEVRERSF